MKRFSHLIGQIGFNVHQLKNNESPCGNIFFHGFTAITSKNDITVLRQAIPIIDNQDSILVQWDSGNIKTTTTHSLCDVLLNHNPDRKANWKRKLFSLSKEILNKTADDAVKNFEFNEKKSDILGSNLSRILEICESCHRYEHINLIGHSLGARLVLQGICSLSADFKSKIKNVVLMGGAIGWQHEFGPCLAQIKNLHVFNLYSSKDFVLIGKPGFERCIGRTVIPESTHYRVTNIHCDGFGHTDYWPQFKDLCQKHNFLEINKSVQHDKTHSEPVPLTSSQSF